MMEQCQAHYVDVASPKHFKTPRSLLTRNMFARTQATADTLAPATHRKTLSNVSAKENTTTLTSVKNTLIKRKR